MNYELLKKLICLDGFICEKQVNVDGEPVYIRPLYIEWLALFPNLQAELAIEIGKQLQKYEPKVLYAVEASILPLATLIAQYLKLPLSIVRKPRNYKHEEDEPTVFVEEGMKKLPAVLLDDAIWSGFTMNHILQEFEKLEIKPPHCYFIFDFSDFNQGKQYLTPQQKTFLQESESWVSYRTVVELAYQNGLISDTAYLKTRELFS